MKMEKQRSHIPGRQASGKRRFYPKMLLIAGDGRNTGKTSFAERILEQNKEKDIIAVKISPHLHELTEGLEILVTKKNYMVAEEKAAHGKDSARFLKAGAARSFLVMSRDESLKEAFSHLEAIIEKHWVLVESGGLHLYVKPGLFVFVKRKNEEIRKTQYLVFEPIQVSFDGHQFDPEPEVILFSDNKFRLKEKNNG